MRIYIATRLENAQAHKAMTEALTARGHTITYDWTTHGSVQDDGPARIREVAINEAMGVQSAELVVVLAPGGRGTHTELGIAIGALVPVILIGRDEDLEDADGRICAFYLHPRVTTINNVKDALDYIDWLEKNRPKVGGMPGPLQVVQAVTAAPAGVQELAEAIDG